MSVGLSMYDGLENETTSDNGLDNTGSTTKKLARGISRATENAAIVSYARTQLASLGVLDTPEFTFSLPDLSVYPDSFRKFLEKDLIENGCLTSLEAAGRLNWWYKSGSTRILWPLATSGDEAEWLSEWQSIVDMASPAIRNQTVTSYQSLEEIHVLALAHALKRPIIVIAETMLKDSEGVAFAPIPFGGVYLPLEVLPSRCHRTPLLLAYHSAHFSPLVTVDGCNDYGNACGEGVSIPLVDPDTGKLLPILFAVDPGPDWNWTDGLRDLLTCTQDTIESLLRKYLDCEYQSFTSEDIDRLSDADGSLSKTARQLIEVAKQFGSLGRSVSKKLWSNMTNKRSKSPPSSSGISTEGLLCVRIKSRRHQYVDQMLQNYLQCAHARYLQDHQVDDTGSELNYGAGKSKFYAASDRDSHASVSKLLPTNTNKDRTLYLSRSTFYNNQSPLSSTEPEIWNSSDDVKYVVKECRSEHCQFFGSPENEYYCSQCWANRRYR
ncbi:OTU domain-containing protein 7A-like isoform X2 [Pseudomyrmex gracilis]|uniref:OTU domain-containing protein 7A-like isoform X2 n=1 Tax=Pseudomyrmex gracilis TaxID=219809 RepID=UPI0009956974|nr:OTU domain-containing protein 7A-like isoform X2 [Pseudomyrmex gracilis]